MEPFYKSFAEVGILLIVVGLILVGLQMLVRYIPNIERLPWMIVWVYRKDGLTLATSPLLIILSIMSLVIHFLTLAKT